jgi:hypothetical protein
MGTGGTGVINLVPELQFRLHTYSLGREKNLKTSKKNQFLAT